MQNFKGQAKAVDLKSDEAKPARNGEARAILLHGRSYTSARKFDLPRETRPDVDTCETWTTLMAEI
jgi:hypothetical protein